MSVSGGAGADVRQGASAGFKVSGGPTHYGDSGGIGLTMRISVDCGEKYAMPGEMPHMRMRNVRGAFRFTTDLLAAWSFDCGDKHHKTVKY